MEEVRGFLGAPKLELVVRLGIGRLVGVEPLAVVVVTHSQEVELRRVERVSIRVDEGTVDGAVHRDLGMAVQVPSHDLPTFAAHLGAVPPDASDVVRFVGMSRLVILRCAGLER